MRHAIIAGGGIGGLTTALALQAIGWRVTVCEAVGTLAPLGVGINVLPHGAEVLHGLGLGPALDATGIRTRAIEYRTRYGHVLSSDPRGVEAGFAFPQYSIHRGALQFLLLDALRARAGAEAVRTGHRFVSVSDDGHGVTATFATGAGAVALSGDILIGADGFHSAVRRALHPAEGPARAEGMMMFRGAHEQAPFGDGRTMVIAGNHDVKFVVYPISEEARQRGRALINWVAEVRHDAPRPASEADWTRLGDRAFIDRFREFRLPDLDIVALMQATGTITEYPMIDRDPLPSWGRGRVTLLGDAAHPMYPIGANGASQTIVDAAALAAAQTDAADPVAGLRAYEDARRPKTAEVVLANRRSGPEAVLDIADARLTGPGDRVEDLVTPAEREAIAARYRQVAGFVKRGETA